MWVFKFSKLTTIRLVCCTNNNDNNNKKNEIGAKVASETRWRTKVCRYWSTKDSRPSRTRNRNEKKGKKRTNHLRPRRLEGQNRSHHESSESKWRLFGGCLEGKTPRKMIRVQSFFFCCFYFHVFQYIPKIHFESVFALEKQFELMAIQRFWISLRGVATVTIYTLTHVHALEIPQTKNDYKRNK